MLSDILTAARIADHAVLGIPPGTDLPEHVADFTISVTNFLPTGPAIHVYLSGPAAEADTPIILPVTCRAGWLEAYRLARVIRPGGRMNGGDNSWPPVSVIIPVEG